MGNIFHPLHSIKVFIPLQIENKLYLRKNPFKFRFNHDKNSFITFSEAGGRRVQKCNISWLKQTMTNCSILEAKAPPSPSKLAAENELFFTLLQHGLEWDLIKLPDVYKLALIIIHGFSGVRE